MEPFLFVCGGRDDNRIYPHARKILDPFQSGQGVRLTHSENECRPHSSDANNILPLPPMSCPRHEFAAASYSDTEVIISGGDDGKSILRTCELFDASSSQWHSFPSMHFPKKKHSLAVLSKKRLISIGGESDKAVLRNVEIYDPKTKNWKAISPLNEARHSASLCVLGDHIYVFGGRDSPGDKGRVMRSIEFLDLSPSSPTPSSSNPSQHPSSSPLYPPQSTSSSLHAISSATANYFSSLMAPSSSTPATSSTATWKVLGELAEARMNASSIFFNDKIYVMGGNTGVRTLSSVEVYDVCSRSWSVGPSMNVARTNFHVFEYEGQVVVFGGYDYMTRRPIVSMETFDGVKFQMLKTGNTGMELRRSYVALMVRAPIFYPHLSQNQDLNSSIASNDSSKQENQKSYGVEAFEQPKHMKTFASFVQAENTNYSIDRSPIKKAMPIEKEIELCSTPEMKELISVLESSVNQLKLEDTTVRKTVEMAKPKTTGITEDTGVASRRSTESPQKEAERGEERIGEETRRDTRRHEEKAGEKRGEEMRDREKKIRASIVSSEERIHFSEDRIIEGEKKKNLSVRAPGTGSRRGLDFRLMEENNPTMRYDQIETDKQISDDNFEYYNGANRGNPLPNPRAQDPMEWWQS